MTQSKIYYAYIMANQSHTWGEIVTAANGDYLKNLTVELLKNVACPPQSLVKAVSHLVFVCILFFSPLSSVILCYSLPPRSFLLTAAICTGLVPQQPPMMLIPMESIFSAAMAKSSGETL